ncbi:MAG: DNA repair protein RadC [Alteromonadaceae bacterium]|jgi:DNA repair protein RadC
MQIKDWPSQERPREKLLAKGPSQLSDAELLAIFLRTGTKGVSAVDLARQLLQHFGGLRALFSASYDDFCAQKGLGAAKFAQVKAVIEMSQRYFSEQILLTNVLDSPNEVKNFLRCKLMDQTNEVFAVVYLDNHHRILKYEALFYGTLDGATIYPRVVVEKVIGNQAAAVIFAHNHPCGNANPSRADIAITTRLKKALFLIDVRVLDHFVVGNEVVSFAERGLL